MFNILMNSLELLFKITNDWGIAIIGLTLGVKLLLLPLSIKQKISMENQQKFTEEINNIKIKYKKNEKKMNEKLEEYYSEKTSNMMGVFMTLVQLPIIMSLLKVVRSINIQNTSSILIPWVKSLQSYDTSYIIPLIYTLLALSPSILNYIGYLRGYNKNKPMKENIISVIVISIMLTLRSPVAISLYFIASSFFSLIEDLIYRILIRKELLTQG